jgi:hypothetical protein
MAKAYFNRRAGRFEMRFRNGKRVIWDGSKWTNVNGTNAHLNNSFIYWYNRKGRYIENRWNRNINAQRQYNQTYRKSTGIKVLVFIICIIAGIALISMSKSLFSGFLLANPSKINSSVISTIYTTIPSINNTNSSSTTANTTTINTTTVEENYVYNSGINQSWASLFFANISAQRGSNYAYCPALSQFAQIRFNSQISHYDISHYGVQQDDEQYGIYDAEEILFPSGSPSGYTSQLSVDDPSHWQLLIDNSYTYYGDYIGNGPDIESYCTPGPEIPGPNINISQYLESKGCTPVTETATYLIVELDGGCPSQLT